MNVAEIKRKKMTTHVKPEQRTNLSPVFGFNSAVYPWLRVITSNQGGNEKIQQGFDICILFKKIPLHFEKA